MNEEIKDLQWHINKEAKQRLDKDINQYLNHIHDHKFFSSIKDLKLENGKIFHEAFWPKQQGMDIIYKKIYDEWLPKYIEKVSLETIQKIQSK